MRRARKLISPRLRRAVDSEDLAHEALRNTAKRPSLVFGSVSALRAYLLLALRSAAAQQGRRERTSELSEAEGHLIPGREATPSSIAGERERADDLDRHLRSLSDREREVVRLRHAEDLGFAAIAARLELQESNARQIYNRALLKLREAGVGREEA